MGAYVQISFGELLDKITILEIKRVRLADPAARENVERELAALRASFESIDGRHHDGLPALHAELREVNETLWEIEDRIRAKEAARCFDEEFIELARSVYRTNDRRSAVKRAINRMLDSDLVEEKHYTPY